MNSKDLEKEFDKFLKGISGGGVSLLTDEQIIYLQTRCEELLKQAIQERVYDMYEPHWYERTNHLKNSVTSKLNADGTLFIYHDITNFDYHSSKTGFSVGELIPYWINTTGHQNKNIPRSKTNMFHHYPSYKSKIGRKYLDYAKELIEKEFIGCGIIVKIFDGR